MFVAFLSTGSRQYVTGYVVASVATYTSKYAKLPNVHFIKATDFQDNALARFIQNYQKYFLQNGKLVLDTTK